ncbi:MAG: RNA polymerase sigma factor [Lachnospiraceae bacterium]|nr:RNA polymerase sigma factor [Lachnospiraceae bacterium]
MVLQIYERHKDALYRLCYFYMGNPQDASDALQNTLIHLIEYEGRFESEAHEKAWLMKVGANECRQMHRQWWKRRVSCSEELVFECREQQERYEKNETLQAVLALPEKYRIPIYMHYYEGYSTQEIAQILGAGEATVRSWMRRGRIQLRKKLE